MAIFTRRHLLGQLGAAALLGSATQPALAAPFPDRPITLIVPFSAGGATDTLVRHLALLAGQDLGQAVIVENKPGASGVLGAVQLVRAAPDGSTLAILPEPVYRLPLLQKQPFDPLRDFSYVIHLSGYALGIAVLPDAPWRDWAALVADAKKRPGEITYGTTGVNSTMHTTMEEISQKAGIQLRHVPYKGESEIIAATLGRQIDLGITAGSIGPMVEAGRARMLVVWTARRVARWPQTPTLREVGLGMVATAPFGLAGPKGMPEDTVKKLHDAFRKALEAPSSVALLERLNQESAYLDSKDYAAHAQERTDAARKLIDRLGLKGAGQ